MSYERDASYNETEPEGSYGRCWKYLTPGDPGSLRCALYPGHDGPCSPQEPEDSAPVSKSS